MKQFFKLTVFVPVFLMLLVLSTGCKKNDIRQNTTEDTNIVDYLRKYPNQFSEFVKILDRTNVSPFLNAYGAYTVFAPTNDAIKLYLQQIGKASTDDLDTAALRNVVRMHIIQDTISTSSFTDGKLANPTMYGQYLVTGVNSLGVTIVNRQAGVTQSNILTGNGYIHVIDHVLQPAQLTAAKLIEQNPKLSIFTQALKATGFYDSLNITNNPDTTRRWLTVLAETDSVLKTVGINTYSDLLKRFNNTGDPKNPKDSLFLYVAYHILPGIKYVADIVQLPSHPTLAPLAVVTTSVSSDTVLLNETTFNDVHEAGIPIDRANSDNATTNGVVHLLKGDIYLKIRLPVRVDFDIAAQPEIIKLTSVYRKPGASQNFSLGQLADVTWQNANLQAAGYYCEGPTGTNFYWKNDGFGTNLRFGNAAANNWTEFVTPLIVAGKYKIWICYRRANMGAYTQVSFDGQPTSRIVDFTLGFPSGVATMTDAVLEAQNLKRYSYENPNGNNLAQLAGVVDVPTTDRHRIRLQAVRDNGSGNTNGVTLDFIQFIPINDVQYATRYSKDGTVYKYP
jgi:uncharacterized surface protein with fasciclin (FAS1) repeats